MTGFQDNYDGVYEIQETLAGGHQIYQKENSDSCISRNDYTTNWWIQTSCGIIGVNGGYAWLGGSRMCPTGPDQTWRRGGSDEPITGAITTEAGNIQWLRNRK